MSVFLRWGIFGILGVAALLYAYNASKHVAEKHAGKAAPAVATEAVPESESEPADALPEAAPRCEEELVVAQHALDARGQGEPLDRLLRSQEIAFQDSPRRGRLEKVATDWFNVDGDAPDAASLRAAVIRDCEKAAP